MSDPSAPLVPPAVQARSRETVDKIVAAGLRLLQEGGAGALTIAAVAQAAGAAVGSVYRRFGDKERLFAVLQSHFTAAFRAEYAQRVADTGLDATTTAREVIDTAVSGVAWTFEAHAPLLRVFMLLGTQDEAVFATGSQASVAGGRVFRDTVMLAAPALRHHGDVEAAIDFAHRLTYATCAHRVVQGEFLESARPLPYDALVRELQTAVAGYLLGPPPS